MSAIFVTGPVRSGKSAFAANLARESGAAVVYVATALRDEHDPEWDERIARHERERPSGWTTLESAGLAPDALVARLAEASTDAYWVFDALGTWLAARMLVQVDRPEREYVVVEAELDAEAASLADALLAFPGTIVVVGEQVGWDVVPERATARLFRDVLGRMSHRIAAGAERAVLLVAGLPLELKA